jgi:hypothetical protein
VERRGCPLPLIPCYGNGKAVKLAPSPEKKAVAVYFGVMEPVLVSWLHSLVYVRNICAHHARFWNKELRISAKIPKKPVNEWPGIPIQTDRKVYMVLSNFFLILLKKAKVSAKDSTLLDDITIPLRYISRGLDEKDLYAKVSWLVGILPPTFPDYRYLQRSFFPLDK